MKNEEQGCVVCAELNMQYPPDMNGREVAMISLLAMLSENETLENLYNTLCSYHQTVVDKSLEIHRRKIKESCWAS